MATPGQSEPGNNGTEKVPDKPQISRIGASPSDAVKCHTKDTDF